MKKQIVLKMLTMMMTIFLGTSLLSVPVSASDIGTVVTSSLGEEEMAEADESQDKEDTQDEESAEEGKEAEEADEALNSETKKEEAAKTDVKSEDKSKTSETENEEEAVKADAEEEEDAVAAEAEAEDEAEDEEEAVAADADAEEVAKEDSVTMKANVSLACSSKKLSGRAAIIYDILKEKATQVANGEVHSTEFTVNADEIFDQDYYDEDDLGCTVFDKNGKLTDEARCVLFSDALDQAVSKLLIDCPYELFWFNKTAGVKTKLTYYTLKRDQGIHFSFEEEPVDTITFRLAVSSDYGSGYYCDDSVAAASSKTEATAKAIVEKYKDKSDEEKLEGYKENILELAAYTNDTSGAYGKKSQITSIFDGCRNTTVLCEAYAKAFQYLCDLTTFNDDSMKCILVSGTTKSDSVEGTHMWNILITKNGNYLIDVTNCEEDAVGASGGLFMTGAAGSVEDGYTITLDSGTSLTYQYDENTLDHYSEDELTLIHKHTAADAVIENKVEATCTKVSSYDKVVYCKSCGKELSRETVIGKAVGHAYQTKVVNPTCTTDGYVLKTCKNCDYEKKTILPNYGGHSWGSGEADEDGNITYTCTVCGAKKCSGSTSKKTCSHTYGSYKTTKAATVFEEGCKVAVCKKCGDKKYASIQKLTPKITLSDKSKKIKVGKSFTLKVSGLAKGDSVAKVSSSNKSKAKYNKGTVKGVAKGSAVITVTLASGKTASCKVTVK